MPFRHKSHAIAGFPESRAGLYLWLKQRNAPPKKKAEQKQINNAPNHPLHPSLETKLAILHRCFIEGENVQLVSEETGYSRPSIYAWRRKYQSVGPERLMNYKDDPRGILKKGIPSSTNEISSLKQQMVEMQLEIDILKETINVLKKDPSVSKAPLKNKEKAAIVDALKDRYTTDVMPFIHSLSGTNVRKGVMMPSVLGGGTSNTEYEFLTGNSIAFLNAGMPTANISPFSMRMILLLLTAIRLCMTTRRRAGAMCVLSDRSHLTMKPEIYKR